MSERKAEHVLADQGVFAGHCGLRRFAESDTFWNRQLYGARLYFDSASGDYLHRDVLRAAVRALDSAAEKDAKIERLLECLAEARCPDYHCDNEGTTVVGFDPCGSPDPGPCQWCHERREALAATATEEKGR